jgi:hypothetical protein
MRFARNETILNEGGGALYGEAEIVGDALPSHRQADRRAVMRLRRLTTDFKLEKLVATPKRHAILVHNTAALKAIAQGGRCFSSFSARNADPGSRS